MKKGQQLIQTNKYASVLIFGPPGVGKGTMSHWLEKVTGVYHLSTGDIFRGLSEDSSAGKLFAKYAHKGLLVPDKETIDIWKYYVDGLIATNQYLPSKQKLLLDGIPRTLQQAENIADYITVEKIVVLTISDEMTLIERLKGRAKKERRDDDTCETVLKKRLHIYQTQTKEVLNYYSADKKVEIDASQSPAKVFNALLSALLQQGVVC